MLKMPQVDLELSHYFADGVYARQGIIPKGCLITGRIHKKAQINIISKGRIAVLTENGEPIQILEAPCIFRSPPGTKRVGLALEETVFTTILATDLTIPEEVEQTLTVNTEEEYAKCLQSQQLLLVSE